jgi:hypothetical protein
MALASHLLRGRLAFNGLKAFLISPMRATRPAHFNLRYFIASLCYCQTKWFEL